MEADARETGNAADARRGLLLMGAIGILVFVVWSLILVVPNPDPVNDTQKFVDSVNLDLVLMAAYVLVVVGLILGLATLYSALSRGKGQRLARWGLVTGALSGALVMADWGALALGTIAVTDAYKDGNTGVVPALKYLEGGNLPSQLNAVFGAAALLALISAVLFAVTMWQSRIFPKWVAVVFALGLIFFAASIPIVSQLGGIFLAGASFTMARTIGGEREEAVSPAQAQTA